MKKQIYDEKNELNYTLHGDYYLPDLEINEEEPTYGKYGIMRKQFLKEHRSARYQYLVLTGKLTEHLNQVDKEVREKVEILMEQMAEQWGVTEELKMQDQMEWVRRMNNIQATAEEMGKKAGETDGTGKERKTGSVSETKSRGKLLRGRDYLE